MINSFFFSGALFDLHIPTTGSEMRGFFRAFATETTETDTETANTVSKK